tara:strand:+ start:530 stop:1396 length:867 start_codon:yes stop_codon:yes gene_type:complete
MRIISPVIDKKIIILGFICFLFSPHFLCQTDSLKILSWNVFLRPSIMKDSQMERVDSVAKFLNKSNADILVLQELFHRRARIRISKLLKKKYPYKTSKGPVSFWGVSSGVMIYSKMPMLQKKRISFNIGKGSDKMAKKGAVKTTYKLKNKQIHVIGTHMQAGNKKEHKKIRRKQLKQIKKLVSNIDTSDLIIYAGDFNIKYKSKSFNYASSILNSQVSYPTGKIDKTANFSDQDYFPSRGKPSWIDFIFIEKKKVKNIKTKIFEPRAWFKKKNCRISDHNPVVSTIKF